MSQSMNGITRKIRLVRGRCGQKRILSGSARSEISRPSKAARKMALAIRIENLLSSGTLESEAELARTVNLDRGVISRLLMLRLLAPDIQEAVLLDPSFSCISMKALLAVVRRSIYWPDQRRTVNSLVKSARPPNSPPISEKT